MEMDRNGGATRSCTCGSICTQITAFVMGRCCSTTRSIVLITLAVNLPGERSGGKPHGAFDVEGAGNGVTDDPKRARQGNPGYSQGKS